MCSEIFKMAQLPPKIPSMTPNWPEFSSQRKMPSFTRIPLEGATNTNHLYYHLRNQNPSWVDEFLDFSSGKRGAHRRAVSDSFSFMEAQMLEEYSGNSGKASRNKDNEFNMFDDDEFMSMFSDDVSRNPMMLPTLSSSNPSSPSDHSSINDEKEIMNKIKEQEMQQSKQVKNESDEDENQCKQEIKQFQNNDNNNDNANAIAFSSDKITDLKRVKRILANRQSAQRSRVRKLQYISELEQSVTSLQVEVSVLSPRVAFLDHQRLLLNVENSALKQRIAALTQDKIFKDAHQEALKREIVRLRQVYHQQNMKKMDIGVGPLSPSPSPSPRPCCDTQTKKEHLINA